MCGDGQFPLDMYQFGVALVLKVSRGFRWAVKRSLLRVILLRRRPLPGLLAACLCLMVTAATVTQFRYVEDPNRGGRARETRETG